LESRNICDYSLLVGIHFLDKNPTNVSAKNLSPAEDGPVSRWHFKSSSIWTRDNGGILAKKPNREIYFMGLVDILTQYDLKKKGERALKSVIYNPEEISAIPPTPYRERFLKYVNSIIQ